MSSAVKVTDHDEIRAWAKRHGARPAHVKATGDKKDDPGILRLDFQEEDEGLEEIEWDVWFARFDESGLALLCSPEGDSRFNKLVKRD